MRKNLLSRFFFGQKSGRFLFALAWQRKRIDELNDELLMLASKENKRLEIIELTDYKTTILIKSLKEKAAGGFILLGLDRLREKDKNALIHINFLREELSALDVPILFWIPKGFLKYIYAEAFDLYDQRLFSSPEFAAINEKIPQKAEPSQVPRELPSSRLKALETQYKESKQNKEQLANDLVVELINEYIEVGWYKEARDYFEQYEGELDTDKIHVCYTVADVFYSVIFNLDEADFYYRKLLKLLDKDKNHFQRNEYTAITYERLGKIYQAKGDMEKAEEYFIRCFELRKELYEAEPS